MNAIRQAQRTRRGGHGDGTRAPSVYELHILVQDTRIGRRDMPEANRRYLAACRGRKAFINEVSVTADVGPLSNKDILQTFFGGVSVRDRPPGSLGSKVMSTVLQLIKLFPNTASRDNAQSDNTTPVGVLSGIAPSYPKGWDRKYLSIGQTETGGKEGLVQDALEDAKALKLTLLFNKIFNTAASRKLRSVALKPYEFDMGLVEQEAENARLFKKITSKANRLLLVLNPALKVDIGSHRMVGGITDISVKVDGTDLRGGLQTEYTAIIELKKPSCAFRAANILAFGDDLKTTDKAALESPIDSSEAPKLDFTLGQLQSVAGSLYKHTVNRINNKLVRGYSLNGQDVARSLSDGYLRSPLDALHFGLEQVAKFAALNGCRHMAVSDGFIFIGTHLRELKGVNEDLVEANFDSHYALDLTEDWSAVKILQYFINAAFRSARVRRYVEILLEAADEHFGGAEISDEMAAEFEQLIKQEFKNKFDFTRDTSLMPSAMLYTKNRIPVVRNALAMLVQKFGAIAESGKYKSSDFSIIKYYRSNELEGITTSENAIPDRSRSVAKVQFHGKGDGDATSDKQSNGISGLSQGPCVLKVYDADAASIKRMERELKAYSRISQLAGADQKSVAKLLAFGAIDLDDVDPRLFIAVEYVGGTATDIPSYEQEEHELDRVCDLLESVGVQHNDLEERNYRWQMDDGKWFIKVFDFDHATFDEDHGSGAVKGIPKTAVDDMVIEDAGSNAVVASDYCRKRSFSKVTDNT